MRTLLTLAGLLTFALAACGGESDDFKAPTPAATALGASVAPGGGTIAPATPTQCAKQYSIVSGDTLSAVALAHDVELQAIIDANELVNPASLTVGQQIIIPCASSVAVSPAPGVATASP